ncbi:MAG: transposase [Kiritimatiellales bacterium]|nr:transposase [Kiritimatiellales bacterium]MCF7863616.1 transposase [Kiritimatiellales bacterium]
MDDSKPYWPHAPMHALSVQGGYMVTGGTYRKAHILNTPEKLTLVRTLLFEQAKKFGWQLQAWAVMSNHYHFVALSPGNPECLKEMVTALHKWSALQLNRIDNSAGRKVWHNYWDSHITHQTSWFARLRYVHQNPVHHGVVDNAANYRWCSQAWLEHNSSRSFINTLARFKTDKVTVLDDF